MDFPDTHPGGSNDIAAKTSQCQLFGPNANVNVTCQVTCCTFNNGT